MLEKANGQFPTFNMVELFWAVLQPASVPFDDNGSERMGTLLRLGIAVKSIWRRPSPFYPARTSSALESCSFLARLPSSPQVVSESHPPAICCWLGFPPEILGKEKKKKRKNPIETNAVLSIVGGGREDPFRYFKEHWPRFVPPLESGRPLICVAFSSSVIQSYNRWDKSIRGWLL